MSRKPTERQREILLRIYLNSPGDPWGWLPDPEADRGGVVVVKGLLARGLIAAHGLPTNPVYLLTPAGRAALHIDVTKPPKRLRKAVQRGLLWLDLDLDGWEIMIGRRQLPVVRLDDCEADYRDCTFALQANDQSHANWQGFLRAASVSHTDDELRWEALGKFLAELGFDAEPSGWDRTGIIGFWPADS